MNRIAKLIVTGVIGGGAAVEPLDPNLSLWGERRTTNAAVYLVSNSVGAGAWATDPATTGWFQKLMAALKTKYGDGGSFVAGWNDLVGVNERTLWTLGTGWDYHTSAIHEGVQNTGGVGAAVISLTGRYYDIYSYAGLATGAFHVSFDGGANETVGADGGEFRHVKTTFDKATSAARSLSLTLVSNWVFCNGIAARSGTGLFGINSSKSGATLEAPGSWVGLPFLSMLSVLQPAITIISHGINECHNNTDPAVFQSNLEAWVDAIGANSSVLITSQNPINETNAYPLTDYVDVCASVAAAKGCAYLDIYELMGGSWAAALASGYVTAGDPLHPTQAGHDLIYQSVYDMLTAG